jgi:hypothetical protein
VSRINPVTGEVIVMRKSYALCGMVNKDGNCDLFEPLPLPESRISRLIRWISGAGR